MWREFFTFDLRFQLRQPLLWLIAIIFGALALAFSSTDAVSIGGGAGNINYNAPVVVASFLGKFTIFSMFVVTIFIAGSVLRDSEVGISDILFATPMRKHDYLFGRFLAGFTACCLIFLFVVLGLIIGPFMPWVEASHVGPLNFQPFIWGFFVLVLPNLLFISAFLMLLAATTRSMIMVYVGVIAFLVLWGIAGALGKDIGNNLVSALLDPFGIGSFNKMIRYYSVHESNTAQLKMDTLLTTNRAVWASIGIAFIWLTVILFKPQRAGTGRRLFGRKPKPSSISGASAKSNVIVRRTLQNSGFATQWIQFINVVKFDSIGIFRSTPYIVMLLLAMLNFVIGALHSDVMYGTKIYPTTFSMIEALDGSYNTMLFVIVTFYAGELVFKERQAKVSDVTDAMPTPNWVSMLGKICALTAVILSFLSSGAIGGICIQLIKGGAPIELPHYVTAIALESVFFILIGILGVFFQVLTNNKFGGYLAMILVFISEATLVALDFDHKLYNFAETPKIIYSDMNGYGHFLAGWLWLNLYWGLFTCMLIIATHVFWVRGLPHTWRDQVSIAKSKVKGKAGLALGACLAAFIASGSWIFYNTNILNTYERNATIADKKAAYEKNYSKYYHMPHPRITDVKADVEIYPEERKVIISGKYVLENKTSQPQETLRVQVNKDARTIWKATPKHEVTINDTDAGFSIWKLMEPIPAGGKISMDFVTTIEDLGFTNSGSPGNIFQNGTFFTNEEYFPNFGYSKQNELKDDAARRERGLPASSGMSSREDKAALNYHDLDLESDWINFETTVSTSVDQTAIAPGYLTKTWTHNGRRYFNYKMDQPMLPFFAYLSARWSVKKETYKGISIEIYHDSKHTYNVDRMIYAVKKSLDYYESQFTPYQHKQVRILEFPRYQAFAQSFANTIPYSEGIGFIADLRDKENIDYVFYVTAHEMAHQWWGHQVAGAHVQGAPMISESLSQYLAMMVMEKEYGASQMHQYLRYELDQYLKGRGKDRHEEMPLARVGFQSHIYYNKGSLIFYRLRDEIGETNLNRALKKFLLDKGFQQAPYPTTQELLSYILDATPKEKKSLVIDMFEKIMFYDNRVTKAEAVKREDGQWDVNIQFHLAKLETNGKGVDKHLPYDEPIEIGIFSRTSDRKKHAEKVLFLEKIQLQGNAPRMTITVKEKPFDVGVDPYNKLIDRYPEDNRKEIEFH